MVVLLALDGMWKELREQLVKLRARADEGIRLPKDDTEVDDRRGQYRGDPEPAWNLRGQSAIEVSTPCRIRTHRRKMNALSRKTVELMPARSFGVDTILLRDLCAATLAVTECDHIVREADAEGEVSSG
jgi:hypothetical protein